MHIPVTQRLTLCRMPAQDLHSLAASPLFSPLLHSLVVAVHKAALTGPKTLPKLPAEGNV